MAKRSSHGAVIGGIGRASDARRPRGRRLAVVAGAVLLAVVVASVCALVLARRDGGDEATPGPSSTAQPPTAVPSTATAPPVLATGPVPGPVVAGVSIAPGESIQAAVDVNPPGTTFVIRAGTHVRQSVIPKSGDAFVGEYGAVMDGGGVATYAFSEGPAPYPSDVTIRNLRITGYAPTPQTATVDAGGYYPDEGSTGWVIEHNEVSYNGEYGVRIGNGARIVANDIHHNKRLNVAGSANDVVVEGNEISFGNWGSFFDTGFEAGGTKFSQTQRLVLRGNDVHDNLGVGLHLDENNIGTLIEGNRVDGNAREGIAVEISYAATIRGNTVTGNGWHDPHNRYTYLWNAGIGVHASPDVEIADNTVSGNYAGIVAIQQDRSADRTLYGPHLVANLSVHDNRITQRNVPTGSQLSVAAGIAQDVDDLAVFTSRGNRFVNNAYVLGTNPDPFAWDDGVRTEAQWEAYGMDASGTFTR